MGTTKKQRRQVQTHSSWRQRKKLKKRWKESKLLEQLSTLHKNESDSGARHKRFEVEDNGEVEQGPESEPSSSRQPREEGVRREKKRERAVAGEGSVRRTLSLALPGSILENAQSPELRSYLAGQVARAAAIFCVDEVIVFDEDGKLRRSELEAFENMLDSSVVESRAACNLQLARILQYLECPQYLRKELFPLSKDLRFAGLLNPLDIPHHMRADDRSISYREAVALSKPRKEGRGSYCNAGLPRQEVLADRALRPGLRVTLKLHSYSPEKRVLKGTVVSPAAPKTEAGLYWGYTVRLARSLSAVFEECPYPGGYDCKLGTSERGSPVESFLPQRGVKHALVVFGGLKGLESCVEGDEDLSVEDPSALFHHYLNTCPAQGSRTIRTEEAVLITLSALRTKFY